MRLQAEYDLQMADIAAGSEIAERVRVLEMEGRDGSTDSPSLTSNNSTNG